MRARVEGRWTGARPEIAGGRHRLPTGHLEEIDGREGAATYPSYVVLVPLSAIESQREFPKGFRAFEIGGSQPPGRILPPPARGFGSSARFARR